MVRFMVCPQGRKFSGMVKINQLHLNENKQFMFLPRIFYLIFDVINTLNDLQWGR